MEGHIFYDVNKVPAIKRKRNGEMRRQEMRKRPFFFPKAVLKSLKGIRLEWHSKNDRKLVADPQTALEHG